MLAFRFMLQNYKKLQGGVRALWNFTPTRILVPEGVVVANTSIYSHLAVMYNRLSSLNL